MGKIAWIDAGHGGHDSGAIGHGLYEKTIVLNLAKRVREILENDYSGVTVKLTRETDVFYSLSQRADMANKAGADFFLSIHVNAGGGTGYEDYIWNGCPTNGETDNARKKIHNAVVPVLNKYGIRNRGMKKANYAVLRETNMNAALVETLFIDNPTEASLLKNAAFLEEIAQAYAKGIAEILGAARKPKPAPTPTPKPSTSSGTIYRVQVGAFKSKANAEALEKQVQGKGFDAFVKLVGGLYKVQVGAYSVKANAEAQQAKLKNAGFNAFITNE
jgi:N-acetylmuramoyl-L-alanine amidase